MKGASVASTGSHPLNMFKVVILSENHLLQQSQLEGCCSGETDAFIFLFDIDSGFLETFTSCAQFVMGLTWSMFRV